MDYWKRRANLSMNNFFQVINETKKTKAHHDLADGLSNASVKINRVPPALSVETGRERKREREKERKTRVRFHLCIFIKKYIVLNKG